VADFRVQWRWGEGHPWSTFGFESSFSTEAEARRFYNQTIREAQGRAEPYLRDRQHMHDYRLVSMEIGEYSRVVAREIVSLIQPPPPPPPPEPPRRTAWDRLGEDDE
jgi:hypothetical protein